MSHLLHLFDFRDIKVLEDCKLVIFDLDDTLIFRYSNDFSVHAKEILQFLRYYKIKMSIASLNTYADNILYDNNIIHYFEDIQQRVRRQCIKDEDYNKIPMFTKIHERLNIPYEKMLLFDDNFQHYIEAAVMNVKAVHVNKKTGVTWKDIKHGMSKFSKRRKSCYF
jgi:FMN phosphatase YigB (HAD superfamily)